MVIELLIIPAALIAGFIGYLVRDTRFKIEARKLKEDTAQTVHENMMLRQLLAACTSTCGKGSMNCVGAKVIRNVVDQLNVHIRDV